MAVGQHRVPQGIGLLAAGARKYNHSISFSMVANLSQSAIMRSAYNWKHVAARSCTCFQIHKLGWGNEEAWRR
jgi:hypothetical protein